MNSILRANGEKVRALFCKAEFWFAALVLAVLKLFRSLFSPRIAVAFAALFCVHPLLSEIVAYISGRNDVLAKSLLGYGFCR